MVNLGYANPGDTMSARFTARQIAAELTDRIRRGQYTPGERLHYDQLADEFDVPRDRIKRAMALVQDRGLVEYWPGIGMHVCDP